MNETAKIISIISIVSLMLITQLFTCYNGIRSNRELETLGQSLTESRAELEQLGVTIRSQESTIGDIKTIQLGLEDLSNKYQLIESGLSGVSGKLDNISDGLNQSELSAEGYESNAYRAIGDTREVIKGLIQELGKSGLGE